MWYCIEFLEWRDRAAGLTQLHSVPKKYSISKPNPKVRKRQIFALKLLVTFFNRSISEKSEFDKLFCTFAGSFWKYFLAFCRPLFVESQFKMLKIFVTSLLLPADAGLREMKFMKVKQVPFAALKTFTEEHFSTIQAFAGLWKISTFPFSSSFRAKMFFSQSKKEDGICERRFRNLEFGTRFSRFCWFDFPLSLFDCNAKKPNSVPFKSSQKLLQNRLEF